MDRARFQRGAILAVFAAVLPGVAAAAAAPRTATGNTPTQTQPTRNAQAALWHLSASQWDRYQTLLKGINGYRSNRLDPLTLLGIEARTPAKRRQYAERLARAEHDRMAKVLAFQRAYDAAWKRLYPNAQPLRTDPIKRAIAHNRQALSVIDGNGSGRLAVFVAAHGCAACNQTVKRLAARHTPMDIFVVDTAGDDNAIRAWAKHLALNPRQVRAGNITLNHASRAAAAKLKRDQLPKIVAR